MSNDEPSQIVRLNVGGTRFEVARGTLMKYEGSMLASLVSGKWKEGCGENEIFIDRDGARFRYVLEYLRTDRVFVHDRLDQAALEVEFDYFGIDADSNKMTMMKDDFASIIAITEEIKELEDLLIRKRNEKSAIQESYRLANEFSIRSEIQGLFLRHNIGRNIDKELLRGCLSSRGLHVVSYSSDEVVNPTVDICVAGLQHLHVSES